MSNKVLPKVKGINGKSSSTERRKASGKTAVATPQRPAIDDLFEDNTPKDPTSKDPPSVEPQTPAADHDGPHAEVVPSVRTAPKPQGGGAARTGKPAALKPKPPGRSHSSDTNDTVSEPEPTEREQRPRVQLRRRHPKSPPPPQECPEDAVKVNGNADAASDDGCGDASGDAAQQRQWSSTDVCKGLPMIPKAGGSGRKIALANPFAPKQKVQPGPGAFQITNGSILDPSLGTTITLGRFFGRPKRGQRHYKETTLRETGPDVQLHHRNFMYGICVCKTRAKNATAPFSDEELVDYMRRVHRLDCHPELPLVGHNTLKLPLESFYLDVPPRTKLPQRRETVPDHPGQGPKRKFPTP